MDTPKFIASIGWESLRTQKTTLLYLITNAEKHGLDSHMSDDLEGIVHLIDGVQDYAVDELGIPEMSVFDFEAEENRDKSTKAEEFARTSAQRIFEERIESDGTYVNYSNGNIIPRAFSERIFDDHMHADIIKGMIKNNIQDALKDFNSFFSVDDNGDYIFDAEMVSDFGGILETYCKNEWKKVPKPVVIRCERCNEKLNPDKAVWLELSLSDGKYYLPKDFPKDHESQGGFSFGKDCARRILVDDPENENKKIK